MVLNLFVKWLLVHFHKEHGIPQVSYNRWIPREIRNHHRTKDGRTRVSVVCPCPKSWLCPSPRPKFKKISCPRANPHPKLKFLTCPSPCPKSWLCLSPCPKLPKRSCPCPSPLRIRSRVRSRVRVRSLQRTLQRTLKIHFPKRFTLSLNNYNL